MKKLNEASNIAISYKANIGTRYPAVAQKGNVGAKYIYAEQLRNNQKETHILRGSSGNVTTPVLRLVGEAAGHTQTWEYSGRSNKWFVGTKPNKTNWAKQIARVNIKTKGGYHNSNTDFPRLAYLDRAGAEKDHCPTPDSMERAEAALSPSYDLFLLATVEKDGTGHFIIYDANVINSKLDNVESNNGYVDLRSIKVKDDDKNYNSFTIANLLGTNSDSIVNSIQGYDIDDDGNIYISSQKYPTYDGTYRVHHKQIVKIPYYARNDQSQWVTVNLSNNPGPIDIPGKHTELEGLQVTGYNHCYLTVAYHQGTDLTTVSNDIYEVSWDD